MLPLVRRRQRCRQLSCAAAATLLQLLLLEGASTGPAQAPTPTPASAPRLQLGIVPDQLLSPAQQRAAVDAVVIDDFVAARAFYSELAGTDSDGDAIILYLYNRIYGAYNVQHWRLMLETLVNAYSEALSSLQFQAKFHHLLFVNSTSGPDAAPLPAVPGGANLTEYQAFDIMYTLGLRPGQILASPLTLDLIGLIGANVRQTVLQVLHFPEAVDHELVRGLSKQQQAALPSSNWRMAGLCPNGEKFIAVDFSFPPEFLNTQLAFYQQFFNMSMRITGEGLDPLLPEVRTLVALSLQQAFGAANSTVRAANVTQWHLVPPATPRRRFRRALAGTAAAAKVTLDITLITYMLPIDAVLPRQLFAMALADGKFEAVTSKNGLPMSIELMSSTIKTRQKTAEGGDQMRITVDAPSGFPVPLAGGVSNPTKVVAVAQSIVDPTPPSNGGGGLSGAAIAGIVVGCALLLAIVVLGVLLVRWRSGRPSGSIGGSSPSALGKDEHSASTESSRVVTASRPEREPGLDSEAMAAQLSAHGRSRSPDRAAAPSPPPGSPAVTGAAAAVAASDSPATPARNIDWLQRRLSAASASSSPSIGTQSDGEADRWLAAGEIEICRDEHGEPIALGKGSFGQVFKAVRHGVQTVAVKRLNCLEDGDACLSVLRKEIAILRKVSFDRNIVQFYGACVDDAASAMLVMEYMEGGDLRHALTRDATKELSWHRRGRGIALDIARGLAFLHSPSVGVLHRDLKSSNILLTADGVAKIGDIGLAKLLQNMDDSSFMAVGTFVYAAPELLLGLRCTDRADIYSFGVLLWEIATQERPLRGQRRDLSCPEEGPPALQRLIDDCMSVDPEQRPSAKQAYQRIMVMPGLDGEQPATGNGTLRTQSEPAAALRSGPMHAQHLPAALRDALS